MTLPRTDVSYHLLMSVHSRIWGARAKACRIYI